jgi:general secretion pathway protein D
MYTLTPPDVYAGIARMRRERAAFWTIAAALPMNRGRESHTPPFSRLSSVAVRVAAMVEETRGFIRRYLPTALGAAVVFAVVTTLVGEAASPSFGTTASLGLPDLDDDELAQQSGEYRGGRRRVSFRPNKGSAPDAQSEEPADPDARRHVVSRYPGRRGGEPSAPPPVSPPPAAPVAVTSPPAPAPALPATGLVPVPAPQVVASAPAAPAYPPASALLPPPAQPGSLTALAHSPAAVAAPIAPPEPVTPAGPPLTALSGYSMQNGAGAPVQVFAVPDAPVGAGPNATHLARIAFPQEGGADRMPSEIVQRYREARKRVAPGTGPRIQPIWGQVPPPPGSGYEIEPGVNAPPVPGQAQFPGQPGGGPTFFPPGGQPPQAPPLPGGVPPGNETFPPPGGFPQPAQANTGPGNPLPPQPATGAGGPPGTGPGGMKLSGQTLNVDFKDTDLRSIVLLLADKLGLNLYIDPSLNGKVTIIGPKTLPIEFGEALLRAILEFNGFAIEGVGQIRRIIKLKNDAPNKFGPFVPFTDGKIPQGTGRPGEDLEQLYIHIFRFKHVGVNEMLNLIRFFIGTGNNVLPYVPGNLIFVVDHPLNMKRIAKLAEEIDVPGPTRRLTPVKVNHAQAKALAEKVTQILQKRTEGEPDPGTREFKMGKPALIPDERTNSILVISLEDDVRMIVSLIEQLDTNEVATPHVKVIHLQYTEAEAIAAQVNQAFKVGGASDPALTYNAIADPKTQSLILSSFSLAMLEKVEDLVQFLDNPTTADGGVNVHHYRMEYADAVKIEKILSGLDQGTAAKGATATKVLADETTNSLVIIASLAKYQDLLATLKKLDVLRPQVLIETLIIELSQSVTNQFSSDYNLIDADTSNARGFALGNSGAISSFFGGQTGGTTLGILAPGTFDITAAATGNVAERSKIQYLYRLFKNDNRANILQSPRVMTADNSTAKLTVGAKVQVLQGLSQSTVPGQIPFANFTSEDLGLSMELTPRVFKGDFVSLKVKAELKDRVTGTDGTINFGPFQTPVFTKTALENEVMLQDKHTLVVGGLIKENRQKQLSKIPGLGDLPIIGRLFSSRNRSNTKNDLLLFLTPHIVRTGFDADRVTDAEGRTLQWRDIPGHTWPHKKGLPITPKQITQDLKRSGLPYRTIRHKPPKLLEHDHRDVVDE